MNMSSISEGRVKHMTAIVKLGSKFMYEEYLLRHGTSRFNSSWEVLSFKQWSDLWKYIILNNKLLPDTPHSTLIDAKLKTNKTWYNEFIQDDLREIHNILIRM